MGFIEAHKPYLKKAAIIWAICAVLFLLAYAIVLRPQNRKIRFLEKTLAEKKQLYESAQIAAQEQTRIELNEQIERLRNRVKDFVVDFENASNLTFAIGQIASEKKVGSYSLKSKEDNQTTSIIAKPETKHVSESQIDINFVGGFSQFANFVNALERNRPVVFVHEFAIGRARNADSVYQVNLSVRAFVRKQQETETAINKSLTDQSTKI